MASSVEKESSRPCGLFPSSWGETILYPLRAIVGGLWHLRNCPAAKIFPCPIGDVSHGHPQQSRSPPSKRTTERRPQHLQIMSCLFFRILDLVCIGPVSFILKPNNAVPCTADHVLPLIPDLGSAIKRVHFVISCPFWFFASPRGVRTGGMIS